MSDAGVEIYRSFWRRDCEDRAFMLGAVGIASAIALREEHFTLEVAEPDALRASSHLIQYEAENRAPRPLPLAPPLHSHAWIGCVGYGAWLLGVAYALSNGLVRLDAFNAGELDAARVQSGQWWRAWTALTLHVSGPHLAANLCAGIWFGYFAGRQLGVGVAWLLIVAGGGIANLVEGLLGPPWHQSVGASTAVFTALGLMSAYTWRERLQLPQGWVQRWGPLVAGIILLGWLGTAGTHTDVMAHLLGFGIGVLLGAAAGLPAVRRHLHDLPQWPAGLAAIVIMAAAWSLALGS
ncbi:MAG TPA: rhomboid family intramembrane serine protease [Steroidobacteraceae bacterium]|nr:rhomboid family intramembrane serine protease [Steroidobacteraceae bacterium]